MKIKYLILFFIFVIGIEISNAQSVLGIPFKSSYEKTFDALEKRFGKYKVIEDKGSLRIYNFPMGDFHFQSGKFMFQYKGDESYLNAATFSNWYDKDQQEIAKSDREYLYSLLKDKYEDEYLEEFSNDFGFLCYKFGLNPVDSSKVLCIISI